MMTHSDELYFIDTNALVYSTFEASNFYKKSIEILSNPLGKYYISNQVINEYFSVVTNPRIFKSPLLKEEALKNVKTFLDAINLIPKSIYNIDLLESSIIKYKILGKNIFDLSIYLTMLENGIENIITANEKHFGIFDNVNVINPFKEKRK